MQQKRNSNSVMESDTIQKNEASSKSHTSRIHFFSYFVIAAFAFSAALTSCGGSGGGSSYKIKMTTEEGGEFFFSLSGSGIASVDWGDGSEKVSLTLKEGLTSFSHTFKNASIHYAGIFQATPAPAPKRPRQQIFSHTYSNATIRTITIRGDNITGIDCQYITSLDVSRCTELTWLSCHSATLVSLDVSKNTALTELLCHSALLVSLDVSKNTALTELNLSSEKLTNLNVNGATSLTVLSCRGIFTNLDLSKNSELSELSVTNSQLTRLDMSKNTKLKSLNCSMNQLTSLDVSKNTVLISLICSGNQLTSLDVSKNNVLWGVDCSRNQLDAAALNAFLGTLHSNPPLSGWSTKRYFMFLNPGAKDCNRSIAERKGWIEESLTSTRQ